MQAAGFPSMAGVGRSGATARWTGVGQTLASTECDRVFLDKSEPTILSNRTFAPAMKIAS